MTGSRLKSELKNPYQKFVYPFWRRPENIGVYSEATREEFERKKLEFEANSRYIQWTVK